MLTARIAAVRKGRVVVLHPFDLSAAAGEVLGVIGPNGAGKSTLLRQLAGAEGAAGPALWADVALASRQIGFMPQAFQVQARLSVLECVLLGRREGLGWRVADSDLAASARALEALGLSNLADRPLDSLSGGQQQMVLLAQRLVREPRLLVLDEPTSALDLHHQLAVLAILRAHARRQQSVVVMALHDLTLAARFCDRLVLLQGGHLQACGAAADILTPSTIRAGWQVDPELLRARDGAPVIVPHAMEAAP
ncbi:MAG: ABC transporter ATP-binding protein [Paracoccaceae bacterium]